MSSTDYFRYNDADEYISEETIAEIQENTSETVSGSGYMTDMTTMVWMDTEQYKKMAVPYLGEEKLEEELKYYEKRGSEITFTYKGNGFLYNMVRILTGTIIEIGMGKIPLEELDGIIEARDRSKAGLTMPARGLTLMCVEYKEDK